MKIPLVLLVIYFSSRLPALCVLPPKAHQYIPSLLRFRPDTTSTNIINPSSDRNMLEFPDGKRLPGSHSRHHSKDRSKLAINGDESSIPRRKSERVLRPKYHHHHKHHRRKAVRIILKPLKPPEGETNGNQFNLISGPVFLSFIPPYLFMSKNFHPLANKGKFIIGRCVRLFILGVQF